MGILRDLMGFSEGFNGEFGKNHGGFLRVYEWGYQREYSSNMDGIFDIN